MRVGLGVNGSTMKILKLFLYVFERIFMEGLIRQGNLLESSWESSSSFDKLRSHLLYKRNDIIKLFWYLKVRRDFCCSSSTIPDINKMLVGEIIIYDRYNFVVYLTECYVIREENYLCFKIQNGVGK